MTLIITDWPNKYPNCGKQPQSPILLDPTDSNLKRDLSRKIELIGYTQSVDTIKSGIEESMPKYDPSAKEDSDPTKVAITKAWDKVQEDVSIISLL